MNHHRRGTFELCLSGALERADLVVEAVVVQVVDTWGDDAGLRGARAIAVPVARLR